MTWDTKLTELKDALAGLIPDEDSIRVIAREAGIPLEMVKLNGQAVNTWSDVLHEAHRRNKVLKVIQEARKRYPDDGALRGAEDAFASRGKTGIAKTPISVILASPQNDKLPRAHSSRKEKFKAARTLTYREKLALLEVLQTCASVRSLDGRSTILGLLYESVRNPQGRTAFRNLQENVADAVKDSAEDRLLTMHIIEVSMLWIFLPANLHWSSLAARAGPRAYWQSVVSALYAAHELSSELSLKMK